MLGIDWAVLSALEHTYYDTEVTLAGMLGASGLARSRSVRRFAGSGGIETMNYRYAHAPDGRRADALHALASVPGVAGAVQRGMADALIALAITV